jgi:hypothetical protein
MSRSLMHLLWVFIEAILPADHGVHSLCPLAFFRLAGARCGVAWVVKSWQDQCLCRGSGVGAAGSPTHSATSLVVLVQPSTWLQAEQSWISPISSSHLPVNFFSLGADSVGLAGPRLFRSLRGLCPERPDGQDEPDPLLDPPACWPASAGPAAGVLSSLFSADML